MVDLITRLMEHEGGRRDFDRYLFHLDIDEFIEEMKRKGKGRTREYEFISAQEILRKLPFFWFSDITIRFQPVRHIRNPKQVVYEVHENSLRSKFGVFDIDGRLRKTSDYGQEIPFDRNLYPDKLYGPEDIEEIQKRYGDVFSNFPRSEPTPLEIGIREITKKGYTVQRVDAHHLVRWRDWTQECLRLYWDEPTRRFMRVEGIGLKDYDYGILRYLDERFKQIPAATG